MRVPSRFLRYGFAFIRAFALHNFSSLYLLPAVHLLYFSFIGTVFVLRLSTKTEPMKGGGLRVPVRPRGDVRNRLNK